MEKWMENREINVVSNIQILCEANNIELSTLENHIKCQKGYLKRVLNGSNNLRVDYAAKIASYFKISVDELLFSNMAKRHRMYCLLEYFRDFVSKHEITDKELAFIYEHRNSSFSSFDAFKKEYSQSIIQRKL